MKQSHIDPVRQEWYEVLYHWTSESQLAEILISRTLLTAQPKSRLDLPGVYLTELPTPEEIRNVLGSDICTEVRIAVPMRGLDWKKFAKPNLMADVDQSGEKYARNAIQALHETVYQADIQLPPNFEYLVFNKS